VRRSIRLKVKGLIGDASKNHSQAISGSSILNQFPFSRFTHEEIIALFRSFRVHLGKDYSQRDILIRRFQQMQRNSFGTLVNQLIDHSRANTFEMVTVTHMESDESQFVIQ
jgi:hypothetical protein